MTAAKNISWRMILLIHSVCRRYTVIYWPYLKQIWLTNARTFSIICMVRKTMTCMERLWNLALGCRLILEQMHRVIEFIQEEWLKPYIDMNTESRKKKTKSDIEIDLFEVISNSMLGKTLEITGKNSWQLTKEKISWCQSITTM